MAFELYNIVVEDANFANFTGNHLQETSQKNNILHIIAKAGKLEPVETILSSYPSLLYAQNQKGNTPLHITARLGHLKLTLLLINHSKNGGVAETTLKKLLRMVNLNKDTVLHEAVRHGHYEIVELLVKEDPQLAVLTNNAGESPLFLAVDREYYRIAFHILEAVERCSHGGRDGMNALHASIIRTRNKKHNTQIDRNDVSLLNCTLFITRFLSASLKLFDFENDHQASITRSEFVSKMLHSYPQAIEEADGIGWTPLHYAAHLGKVGIVEQILRKNKSMAYFKDKQGMSALHVAAKAGEIGVVRTLVDAFPDSSELVDGDDRTALHVAAESGRIDVVKELMKMMPFHDIINQEDKEGNTVLHVAAAHGHYEVIEYLAGDQRVDKLAKNKQGLTAIDVLRSDMQLLWTQKAQTISKLEKNGFLPSLQRAAIRDQTQLDPSKNNIETQQGSKLLEKTASSMSQYMQDLDTVNLLVCTIIATVTFSATFQMPGGYNSEGMAILRNKSEFREFLIYNTLAFGLSVASMFIHFESVYMRRFQTFSYPITFVTLLTEASLLFMASAFLMGTRAIMEKDFWFGKFTWSLALVSFMLPFLLWIAITTRWLNFAKSLHHHL